MTKYAIREALIFLIVVFYIVYGQSLPICPSRFSVVLCRLIPPFMRISIIRLLDSRR